MTDALTVLLVFFYYDPGDKMQKLIVKLWTNADIAKDLQIGFSAQA